MKTGIIVACFAAAAGVVSSSPVGIPTRTTQPTWEQGHGQDLFDPRWRTYYKVKLGGTRGKVLVRPPETYIWDPEYPACEPSCTPHADHMDVVINPIPIHKYRPQEYYSVLTTPGPLNKYPPYSNFGKYDDYGQDGRGYFGDRDGRHDGHDGHHSGDHGGDGHDHHDKDGHHHHHRREENVAAIDESTKSLEPRSHSDSTDDEYGHHQAFGPDRPHIPGSEYGYYPPGSKENYPTDPKLLYPLRYGWDEHIDGEEEPFLGANERLLAKYNYDARGCAIKGLIHDESDRGCLVEDPDRGFLGTSRVKVNAKYPKVKGSFGQCCPCRHHKREELAAEVEPTGCCSCEPAAH